MNKLDIPKNYQISSLVHQKTYLVNGELIEWDGPISDVYSTISSTTDYSPTLLGSIPLLDKEQAMNEWFTKTLVEKLGLLEHLVDGEGYSVGNRLSLSDVVIFAFITQFFDNKEASMNATLATPKIRSIVENVALLPQVVSWLEKRPVTDF